MTDPYPWIPSREPSRNPLVDEYPKRIDPKQAKSLASIQFRKTFAVLIFLAFVATAVTVFGFSRWMHGEISSVDALGSGIGCVILVAMIVSAPTTLKPRLIENSISLGMIPMGTNLNITTTYQRINQTPGWNVVAAQDWAEMCDLADEATAAYAHDLTGPRELQAYNDAIRDYAFHIERNVAHAREIEAAAYSPELDQLRADAIRARAPQLEQNDD